jgi:4'-phosphopantetheinyl transferase
MKMMTYNNKAVSDSLKSKVWERIEGDLSALHAQPLTDSDIHVWCASLNVSAEDLSHYVFLLSPDEKMRVERFYFEKDRNYFSVGRGLLRILIGHYLKIVPSQIDFFYEDYGKPALKSVLQDKTFEFNLSHSQGLALYVFSWNRKVGIDVEHIHPMPDMDDFAERFFSPRESALINSLSGQQKEIVFFKLWTCKEAFLKANGNGLTLPINQVEISLEAEGSVRLETISEGKEQTADWRLELFNPIPGYQAALAVEGKSATITTINFPPDIFSTSLG